MRGPLLPGEDRSLFPIPSLHFMVHRLGQLEAAYRAQAAELLARIPADDDLAAEVRRVVEALDGC